MMNASDPYRNAFDSKELSDQFRKLSTLYANYAEEAGVKVVPFWNPDLPLFSAQTEARKAEAIRALKVSVEICQAMKNSGNALGDSPSLIWQALKRLGLRPPSDLFSKITNESVVEIHSSQGIQLFRNFNFYRFCSYSIEELTCESWEHLFIRDPGDFQALLNMAAKLLSMKTPGTLPMDVPAHRVRESASQLKNELELKMLYGAPLFDEAGGSAVATIVIESANLIASHALKEKPAAALHQLVEVPPLY